MSKPIVAIVGRPNVGKSTLFNYLAGKRISIVDDTPGVTRDRLYAATEWLGRTFMLIDTGGIDTTSPDNMTQYMLEQATIAIESADVIIFMVDSKHGLLEADKEVAQLLRESQKPVVTVVNKVDRPGEPPLSVYDFYELSMGELFIISSIHGMGIGDVLDEVIAHFPESDETEEAEDDVTRVAVIGKPNSGKSSLINKIMGQQRVIVSDEPGTTRDAIDTEVIFEGKKYIMIDTAGIRRQSKIDQGIEKYAVIRSWTAVDRADVCILMIDAKDGITEQDAKIAGYAHEQGKSTIVAINKWDLIEKNNKTMRQFEQKAYEVLSFMTYAPIVTISALTGQRITSLFPLIDEIEKQASIKIPTGMLNDILNEAMSVVQPPIQKGRRLKIYYMTQVGIKPPTFVLFVNDTELMHYSYERYILNRLRDAFEFKGTPIQFMLRERNEKV